MLVHCYMNVLVFTCAQLRDSSIVVEIRKSKRDREQKIMRRGEEMKQQEERAKCERKG